MAYPTQFGYHPAPTQAVINRRRLSYQYDVDNESIDPGVLAAADSMQSPADAQSRKRSFAHANGVHTPVDSQGWNPTYSGGLPVDSSPVGQTHPCHDDHNGYPGRTALHVSTYVQQPHPESWGNPQGSTQCTPTSVADLDYMQPAPPGYEHAQFTHHRNDSARGSFSHAPQSAQHAHPPQHFNHPHQDAAFAHAPQVQTPMSPQSHSDWMAMAQQEVESRNPKRMRSSTPGRTSVDMQRRDGIRKKNGRIEIPHDRNIATIDELIDNAGDNDELLKELKQQKRLLRNREAALASRQRKKKHTEDLESREKVFNQQMNQSESHNSLLAVELQNLQHNNNVLTHERDAFKRANEILQEEKRDIELRHTEESATLRKRIQILHEQLDAGPAPNMSAQPSSAGFNDFTGGMEALNMDPHAWDIDNSFNLFDDFNNNNIGDDFPFDLKSETTCEPVLDKRISPPTVANASEKKSPDNSGDPPIASGLLFFLLLCGAFVASKPASSRPAYIPHVPEDVQAAAPAVINNLLSDASSTPAAHHPRNGGRAAVEPAPSDFTQTTRPRGRLDQVHQRITSPTKEQEATAAFSLTTRQYASISGMDYLAHNEESGPSSRHQTPTGHRPRLAETLANMQNEHARNNKADVYTRSLLWEQIPADVLRQFREMARDHNDIETRQTQMTHDDMHAFKVEQ